MSHFSVLVAAEKPWLHEKLIPYKQYGWGDDDDGIEPYLLQFSVETPADEVPAEAAKIVQEAQNKILEYSQYVQKLQNLLDDPNTNTILEKIDESGIRPPLIRDRNDKDEIKQALERELESSKSQLEHLQTAALPELLALYDLGKFSEVVMQYNGGTTNENGDIGFYFNPQEKWDWYEIGGRYTGKLILKKGYRNPDAVSPDPSPSSVDQSEITQRILQADLDFEQQIGNGVPGLMTPENTNPILADYAPAGAIDWEAMREASVASEAASWNNAEMICQQAGVELSEYLSLYFDGETEELRKLNGKIQAAISGNEVSEDISRSWMSFIFWEPLGKTIEDALESARNDVPFWAYVDDYGWHDAADMGMWASYDREIYLENKEAFRSGFWEFVENLPADQVLTVVDCHI